MQRKFLEDLGLEKEVIDKIMKSHGETIEKTKEKLEFERDNYKGQLETAQNALKEFEGVDVEKLQGEITKLTTDLTNQEAVHQSKLADIEFNSVLDGAMTSSGAKSTKALLGLLDVEVLKASKNQSEDIKTAIEAVKADNDYLFNSDEPFKNPVRETGTPTTDPFSAMRNAMGLSDK